MIDYDELENSFLKLGDIEKKTDGLRDKISNKLETVIDAMTIDCDMDKATVIDAKLNVLKTVDDILKSKENTTTSKIKLIMQKQNIENIRKSNDNTAEILKSVSFGSLNTLNNISVDLEELLAQQFNGSGEVILDGELSE